jgi:hypothetical protein
VNGNHHVEPPGAGLPLDTSDVELLREIRDCWDEADPMPVTLIDQVRVAVDMDGFDEAVLRMTEVESLAGTRGDEQSRMITFESESLTITVSLHEHDDGTIRLDGWLSPPGCHQVELRQEAGPRAVTADEGGRFMLDRVPHGAAQLVVRPAGRTGLVSTPRMDL